MTFDIASICIHFYFVFFALLLRLTVTDAINEGAVYKFLTKPWDDSLLREHVAESFRHFESGRALLRKSPALPAEPRFR